MIPRRPFASLSARGEPVAAGDAVITTNICSPLVIRFL
jgi:hypothetical protein